MIRFQAHMYHIWLLAQRPVFVTVTYSIGSRCHQVTMKCLHFVVAAIVLVKGGVALYSE